jgi:hypothetical protein
MEHPLIGSLDELTETQVSEKINELNKKLGIAARTGNAHLCNQIRMAIETYQNKYQQLINTPKKGAPNFDDKIKIQ